MVARGVARSSAGRWNVAVRALAAVPGNYLLTALVTACLARALPMPPADASIAATLFSFALFAFLALAAFAVRSVARLWLWMGGGIVLPGGILWLSISIGGRL